MGRIDRNMSPFPSVMSLRDNPKPVDMERGETLLGMSGWGLTFSHRRAPVGGSQLPLPGGRLQRACLRKPVLGESHIGSWSGIRTRGHHRCTAQRPDRDVRLGLLPRH